MQWSSQKATTTTTTIKPYKICEKQDFKMKIPNKVSQVFFIMTFHPFIGLLTEKKSRIESHSREINK